MKGLVKRLFPLFVIVSMLAIPAASQTDRWTINVKRQLRQQALAIGVLAEREVMEPYQPFIGSLGRGSHQDIRYRLNEGTTYIITGACDQDCSDLDFELWSGDARIKKDDDPDANPMIVFSPPWTGTYVLRAKMLNCSTAPCRFGVGIFK